MIPFNKPYLTGKEKARLDEAFADGKFSGDGPFTKKCQAVLEQMTGAKKALLTHSCTAALEMAAILADIQPGDEVIMPSYTFVSTANAFVLRGGIPVFVDIRADTLNIDESLIEKAITPKTKAIVPVHYAGVACEMDAIMDIAGRRKLLVIEDAAQGVGASYNGKPLGSIGHLGCFSFHETKNIHCGEGGALLINDEKYILRSEIIREKGTNRSRFLRGQVDKYTWVDIGSSFLPSDLNAAFLLAQLEDTQAITQRRLDIWNIYHNGFARLEDHSHLKLPTIPGDCSHNAHMYYALTETNELRDNLIDFLKQNGVSSVFHYVPLHQSEYARRTFQNHFELPETEDLAQRLVRFPMFFDLQNAQLEKIIKETLRFFKIS